MADDMDFAEQERELLRKLNELRQKQEQYNKEQEEKKKNQELAVTVTELKHDKWIHIKLNIGREDILQILRGVYNRTYSDKNQLNNAIPIRAWDKLKADILNLPNVSINYDLGVEDAINAVVNGPKFFIDVARDKFVIKPSALCLNPYILQNIPSANQRHGDETWSVNLVEGFQIAEILKNESVHFSETAQNLIEYQVRVRTKIDSIALKEDSPTIRVPFQEGEDLKPFQRVAVEFAEAVDCNCIDADEMGLGKTVVALGIVARNNYKTCIVVPASLRTNWVRMFKKFTGMEPVALQGLAPDEYHFVTLLIKKPQVVIISYEMIGKFFDEEVETLNPTTGLMVKEKKRRNLWVELLNMAGFDIIFYDEAHRLKNVDSKRSQGSRQLKAPRVMPLTGTPVTNRPKELWPLLHLVAPDMFPNFEQFALRYSSPDGKGVRNEMELKNLIKPYVIRRKKKDVIKDLPPINRITEYHDLSKDARTRYNLALEGVYQVLQTYNPSSAGDQWKITSVLAQLVRLKQICTDDKLDDVAEFVTNILDQNDETEKNNKIIVFSQFQGSVHGLQNRLAESGVVAFDGTTPKHKRTEMQDAFQNDDKIQILVTTTQVAGEGLTLTRAGHIVFTDLMWTPAAHEQAEARAYGRVNDLHSVNSYYFISTDTIEEYIWELLAAKMQVIAATVDSVNEVRMADISIANEIIKRLKGMR